MEIAREALDQIKEEWMSKTYAEGISVDYLLNSYVIKMYTSNERLARLDFGDYIFIDHYHVPIHYIPIDKFVKE